MSGSGNTVTSVSPSGDPRVDGSLRGVMWFGGITYSDPDSPSDYQVGYSSDPNKNGISVQNDGFSQLSAAQLMSLHFALNSEMLTQPAGAAGFSVEGFTNLTIDYAGSGSGAGTIRMANSSDTASAYAFYPSTSREGGDAWMGPAARNPVAGDYSWFATLHEVGHSLGLKHSHDTSFFGALPDAVNSMEFSLMTYATYIGDLSDVVNFESYGAPQTYMMLDIAALQHMYGADYTTNSGDTEYSWDPNTGETFVNGQSAIKPGSNRIFSTVWDGGGNDTYNLINYSSGVTVDLNPGSHSVFSANQLANLGGGPNGGFARGNIFNALLHQGDERSLVENAIGGRGNDTLIGNQADNSLLAHFGNDRLTGNGGNDTLIGGDGNDWIEGESGNNPLPFGHTAGADNIAAGTGDDVVLAGGGNDLVHGEADNDTIVGEGGDDVLYGGDGNDAVDGRQGGDVLFGGTGVDILFGDADGDTLYGGEGNDVMMGERGVDSVLGALDILYGEAGDDLLDGSAGDDRIYGGVGNDVINGDYGSDMIVGGFGADICLGSGASEYSAAQVGNDLFVFTSMADAGDRIWGFDTRLGDTDGIDLRALFDEIGYGGTNPLGEGFLALLQSGNDCIVAIDTNGGGDAFVGLLTLHGVPSLTTDVFLFQ